MSKRVYIETTVASYFTARPSRDVMIAGHQEATRELWPKFASTYEAYVSALVYAEAGKGDPVQAQMRLAALKPFRMLDVDEEARTLAEKLVAGRGIPEEYPEDAFTSPSPPSMAWTLSLRGILRTSTTRSPGSRSAGLSKKRDTCVPRFAHPKNCWRLTNERPNC